MKISVVVPAFNEEKLLGATLRSIRAAAAAFTERGWEFELVVCNNNSTDRTPDIAREEGAKVIFEPVNQISRARNTGASAATGDWFVFVDGDSHPSKELFADLADTILTGNILGGGCKVKMDEFHLAAAILTGVWNFLSRIKRWAAGSFVYCEAATFRELGGFSLELFASEEIEFSERLKAVARQRGKDLKILSRHPLVTSARKVKLYSMREHWRVIRRVISTRGSSLRSRDAVPLWYDGRR